MAAHHYQECLISLDNNAIQLRKILRQSKKVGSNNESNNALIILFHDQMQKTVLLFITLQKTLNLMLKSAKNEIKQLNHQHAFVLVKRFKTFPHTQISKEKFPSSQNYGRKHSKNVLHPHTEENLILAIIRLTCCTGKVVDFSARRYEKKKRGEIPYLASHTCILQKAQFSGRVAAAAAAAAGLGAQFHI